MRLRKQRYVFLFGISVLVALTASIGATVAWAANHRSAPITALDNAAGIPDVFAFRSYETGATDKVTLIMTADPFREPGNGPVWFLFDDNILYEIKVDNNNDAVEDIVFQFRFSTEQRLPDLFQVYAGVPGGAVAPGNSPPPVAPGTPIVPDRIDSFGDAGLGQLQTYTVTMLRNEREDDDDDKDKDDDEFEFDPEDRIRLRNPDGSPFFVVPTNVGPRTMDYQALFAAGTYTDVVADGTNGISVFAGIVDDPFWLDLGATFDTLNLRTLGSGVPAVLTPGEDAEEANFASDEFSGYAVNAIAIEVPIAMLTRTGEIEAEASPAATIGVWATTSRPRKTIIRDPDDDPPIRFRGDFRQIQRMANPLINELFVGIGFKNRFSMDEPKNDSQFGDFFLDPRLARVINALTGGVVAIPAPPRVDLLPLVTYAPPIAATGTPPGPIADLLRLNTGVPATPVVSASRLGILGGDNAGFPNGRRVFDDVTDIALRVVTGVLVNFPVEEGFNVFPNNRLGDGVNVNDAEYPAAFPYLADGPSGRDSRHVDPGEEGCTGHPDDICPID